MKITIYKLLILNDAGSSGFEKTEGLGSPKPFFYW